MERACSKREWLNVPQSYGGWRPKNTKVGTDVSTAGTGDGTAKDAPVMASASVLILMILIILSTC